jgi:hypothetical protein
MNTELILELVETAIELAQSQMSGTELEHTLLDIVRKGVDAYQEHTGETLDPSLIGAEESI